MSLELVKEMERQNKKGLPKIAIIGRPNVGKSTLFNRLIGRRRAITDPTPGVTRDIIEESFEIGGFECALVDTGGYKVERNGLDDYVVDRSLRVIRDSDLLLLLLDVNELTGEDYTFLDEIRPYSEKTILVVNKVDNEKRAQMVWDFYSLGFETVIPISAAHGKSVDNLREEIINRLQQITERLSVEGAIEDSTATDSLQDVINIAILGKPNTGKSTLLNRLLGEDRAIVSDIPGTTRDTVDGFFSFSNRRFRVIDTAGIRRKKKIEDNVEYYSVNRAIRSIEEADVVFLMIDSQEGLSEQDKKIAGLVVKRGRGIVLVLNKWDIMENIPNRLQAMKDRVRFLFPVLDFAPLINISALKGDNVKKLLNMALQIYAQLNRRIETSYLNEKLREWMEEYPLPVRGKNIKIRYATQVSVKPLKFVFFVNKKRGFPSVYKRYLENKLRRELGFSIVPLDLEIRQS